MKHWLAVLSCVAACIAVSARADYLDTLGPPDVLGPPPEWTLNAGSYLALTPNDTNSIPYYAAMRLLVGGVEVKVPSVRVAIAFAGGVSDGYLDLYVASDSGGNAPGSTYFTISSGASWSTDLVTPEVTEIPLGTTEILQANTTYWLVARANPYFMPPPGVDTEYRWYYNTLGLTGQSTYSTTSTPGPTWGTPAGGTLTAYTIPEPSTALLALLGLGFAGLRRRRG